MSKNRNSAILQEIASRFQVTGEIKSVYPLGTGIINDSFIVKTASLETPDYLLQRKNKRVFQNIPGMMDNILKVTTHLKQKIIAAGGNPDREALTLTYTNTNELYTLDDNNEYWAMCLLIDDHKVYQKADTKNLVRAGGKGIGRFQYLLTDFEKPLIDTLPGFHNIRYRFEQWDGALKDDKSGRKKEIAKEIAFIESRGDSMLEFWEQIESGHIPVRITHNDNKISNILFNNNDEILCVIDLDTVQKSTVLNDFGDAIRSYANTGKEDEEDISRVDLNMDYFEAYTEGYLSEALQFLSPAELENLAFSAVYITYEQTLRFLMDYIDGDYYYKVDYPKQNLVRARAQKKLLESMEAKTPKMKELIRKQSLKATYLKEIRL